jgi:regulator of sigma E protease
MSLFAIAIFCTTKLIPFTYALIGFGLLIAIHEFGHFIFCKIFNIHTPTFSIGMGPTIFQKQVGKTLFRLAAIPLGGYVEISGMAEVGQGDQKYAADSGPESFSNKSYWKRFLVLMGGILFNILFAYLTYSILLIHGMPHAKEMSVKIESIKKDSIAEEHDLRAGDLIIATNKHHFSSEPSKLFGELQKNFFSVLSNLKNKPASLTISRNGKTLEKRISLKKEMIYDGTIGVVIFPAPTKTEIKKLPPLLAFYEGLLLTKQNIVFIFHSIKRFVSQGSLRGAGGPIMILSQSSKMAQKGIKALLLFLALISINLAVVNILPLGALDGGQLLFETIEAVIRRRIPHIIRLSINIGSWILLLSLLLLLSYNDIVSLLTGR